MTTNRIVTADFPMPFGDGQKIHPDPLLMALIVFPQPIAVADRNEIWIRAEVTYGPVHKPIVDESVHVCGSWGDPSNRPGSTATLPVLPEHDAKYVAFGLPTTAGAVSVSGPTPRPFFAVTMHV